MKARWSLLTLFVLLLSLFSFRYAMVPDPEVFGQKLMEAIKKNNKQEYLNTFYATLPDVQWAFARMKNDPYINPDTKQRWEEGVSDSTAMGEMNAELARGYENLEIWIEENDINTTELEYIGFFYELEYERQGQMYVIEDGDLYVKYHDRYFCIQIDEAVYLNNRWVLGRIQFISERNQYLDSNYDSEYMYADSTVAAADTVKAPEGYDDYEEYGLTKKQQKLQKKIIKLEQKTYKLYEEIGVAAY